MPEIIKVSNVRCRYANIFVARAPNVSAKPGENPPKPRYDITVLVPKGSEQDKLIRATFRAAAIETWGKDGDAALKELTAKDRIQYRDGDASLRNHPEYAGHMVLVATRAGDSPYGPPEVRDRDPSMRLKIEDGRPYSGCMVTVLVQPYGQREYSGRLNCGLMGVQFMADGDRLGPAVVDENSFDKPPEANPFAAESDSARVRANLWE